MAKPMLASGADRPREVVAVLHAEHQTIGRLLRLLSVFVRQCAAGQRFDRDEARRLTQLLHSYADGYHHAREDRFLFSFLRLRDPRLACMLDVIECHHQEARWYLRSLGQSLAAIEQGCRGGLQGFERNGEGGIRFLREAMRREEMYLFPLARGLLSARDQRALASKMARIHFADSREIAVLVDRLESKHCRFPVAMPAPASTYRLRMGMPGKRGSAPELEPGRTSLCRKGMLDETSSPRES